jgi:hypothetical protein
MFNSTLSSHRSPGKTPVTSANRKIEHRRLRKQQLISLGLWGLNTNKGWIVRGVQQALQREGSARE